MPTIETTASTSATSESGIATLQVKAPYPIVRIRPDVIGHYWHVIKHVLEQSFPPSSRLTEEKLSRLQQRLLDGVMEAWMLEGEDDAPAAIVVVEETEEVDGTKNLLIYSMYGFKDAPLRAWVKWKERLFNFYKRAGCEKVVAYVWDDDVKEMAKKMGGRAEYTLVEWDLIGGV